MEIKLWVLLGLIGFFSPLIIWGVKWSVNRVVSRLDTLVSQNESIKIELTRHNEKFVSLKEKVTKHGDRLDNHDVMLQEHDRRIYDLEQNKR